MNFGNLEKSRPPIFIIGSPRSGTTLLRLILTNHSQILIPPECGFVIWLQKKYKHWSKSDSNSAENRKNFLNDLKMSKKFDTWSLDINFLENEINNIKPDSYASLCETIYLAYAKSQGRNVTLWGDKNNFHIDYLRNLQELFPSAVFLHIVRDGRDVACSYREVMEQNSSSPYAPKLVTGLESIAQEWVGNLTKINVFMDALPMSQKQVIRYEDLVSHSKQAVQRLCQWLQIPYEPEMLDFYKVNIAKQLEPTLTMDWKKRTLQPIADDTVGRYRSVLTEKEQTNFLEIAHSVLASYGYIQNNTCNNSSIILN